MSARPRGDPRADPRRRWRDVARVRARRRRAGRPRLPPPRRAPPSELVERCWRSGVRDYRADVRRVRSAALPAAIVATSAPSWACAGVVVPAGAAATRGARPAWRSCEDDGSTAAQLDASTARSPAARRRSPRPARSSSTVRRAQRPAGDHARPRPPHLRRRPPIRSSGRCPRRSPRWRRRSREHARPDHARLRARRRPRTSSSIAGRGRPRPAPPDGADRRRRTGCRLIPRAVMMGAHGRDPSEDRGRCRSGPHGPARLRTPGRPRL